VKSYSGGIRHDYKNAARGGEERPGRRWAWFGVGLIVPLVAVSLLMSGESQFRRQTVADRRQVDQNAGPVVAPSGPITMVPGSAPATHDDNAFSEPAVDAVARNEPRTESQFESPGERLVLAIRSGDSLDLLFGRHGLSRADLAAMVALPEAGEQLARLRPGDEIEIRHEAERVLGLKREVSDSQELRIIRNASGYAASFIELEIETRTVGASAAIQTSLFEAAMDAGLSDAITLRMAYIFQWDIDFIMDVRTGDRFTVIYEERWRDGIKLGNGNVVAAEFINRGTSYRAARYVDAGGRADHYTPEGRSVRKAFIRAPVDFTRISDNFNPNRRHPVLNTIRAHRGVDYAAPIGTPVKAAGDGRVEFRGVNGGFGNAVVLQHGLNVTTLYGHLSRFGQFRQGSRVKQNDIIGYVGQSGLATGPHLHYEYRLNGVHRNPRTVELPPADPVPAEYFDDFKAQSASLWQQLDVYQQNRFAGNRD
jgi:murein DD-endopeptidase MepM/ murein hydrolase activator NlpD